MVTYNIKNQEDFNKIYPTLSTRERGRLGYAFPEYYNNYMNTSTTQYQEAMKAKRETRVNKAEQEINKALRKDIREETLKAIAGKDNKYFKPLQNQEQRNKLAQSLNKSKDVRQIIINEANKQGVDPKLALAVAQHESGLNPNAKGDGGKSYGLFQIYTTAHPDYKGGLDPQKNAEYGIRFLKNLLNRYNGDVRTALRAYNGGHGGINLAQTAKYADAVMGIYNGNTNQIPTSTTPVVNNVQAPRIDIQNLASRLKNIYSSQNAQEDGLNNFYNQDYLDQIQPALTGQEMASNLNINNPSNQYLDIARQGYNNIEDLAKQSGGYIAQPVQGERQTMINDNQGLAQYLQLLNEQQQQKQQQSADLLKLYNEAIRKDQAQNTANMIANIASNQPAKAPSTWLTPWGTVTQQYDRQQPLNLPTSTNTNLDALKGQLAVQQLNQKANADIAGAYKDALVAQQMSNVTGLPSEVFLNPDLYKTYAQYIQNPEVSEQAQFKREAGMAPINLTSDLSKQAMINAGNLDVTNLKGNLAGQYQLKNTELAGANQYRNAILASQTQRDINNANIMAQAMIANANNETKLQIARQTGANALQLAELQDALYSNNPIRQQQANAQLSGAMANLMLLGDNPEQGFTLYNRIINMGNPNTQTPTDGLSLDLWND